MNYEWDEGKNAANLQKHQVEFSLIDFFRLESALIELDDRYPYDEQRFTALGFIGDRLYACVFTWRGNV